MAALSPHWKRPGLIAAFGQWWRDWRRTSSELSELESCGADEARRIAQDIGVSVSDLRTLTRHGSDAADLLLRRMSVLHIDPAELARTEPTVFRDLQRLCTMCKSKGRCIRDLDNRAADPAWEEWRDYCPNATTLSMLSTVEASRGLSAPHTQTAC